MGTVIFGRIRTNNTSKPLNYVSPLVSGLVLVIMMYYNIAAFKKKYFTYLTELRLLCARLLWIFVFFPGDVGTLEKRQWNEI